mgnify:CR=1 FL=1
MSTRSSTTRPVAALLAALAASGAAAQSLDIYWPGIPDFDQRRETRFDPFPFVTHLGLPNNGSVHCVPTAISNNLAILDDSGFNVILNASQPNWNDQLPLYNTVSNHLFNFGEYCDTDDGGTTFANAIEGLSDWIVDRGHGSRFFVIGYKADDENFPRTGHLYTALAMGWPTTMAFGRYYRDGDQLERDGGHAITIVGVLDAQLAEADILYHDPATKPSTDPLYIQSPFSRVQRTLFRRYLNIDGDMAIVNTFDESFNGTADDPVRILDSRTHIVPLVVLGTHPLNPNVALSYQLPGVFKGSAPSITEVPSPTGGTITDISFDHTSLSHLITSNGGREGPAGAFRYNPATREITRVATFDRTPERVLLDRFGHLYTQVGSIVNKYKIVDDRPIPLGSVSLPFSINAWAIDDATDTIRALGSNNSRILTLSNALAITGNTPVPSSITLPGDGSVAINPITGRLWLASSQGSGAFELALDQASGRFNLASTASHSRLRNIRGFDFNADGHLLALADGELTPFVLDPQLGRWAPSSNTPWNAFRSVSLGKMTFLTRTRHNEAPRNTPRGWYDIDPIDEPAVNEVPACEADFNLDGFVDFFDYADFVQCYEGRECPRGRDADITADGFVDFFDFTRFVDYFEAGC